MRLRTAAAAAVLAAALSFPLAGVAAAQDRDCADFPNQAEAQEVFNFNRSDPYGLDRDEDGIACETRPGGTVGDAEGPRPPRGGVETGAGGTAPGGPGGPGDDGPDLLVLAIAGGAVLATGGVVLARRRAALRGD